MKKVLALVLTAAMLLSCMIVGISAIREYSVVSDTYKVARMHADARCLQTDPYSNSTNWNLKVVVKGSMADFGEMPKFQTFYGDTPNFDFAGGTIGYNGAGTVKYAFADETWYTIEWIADGSGITIKVNGETVGTLGSAKKPLVYNGFYSAYVKEFTWIDDNGTVYFDEDFADGVDDVFSADVVDYTETTVTNENVSYAKYNVARMHADARCLQTDPYSNSTNWNLKVVVKGSMADFGEMPKFQTFYGDTPNFDFAGGTIGYNGAGTVKYAFADETWYTIEWIADGSGITIKVNGETVGTLGSAKKPLVYNGFYSAYVKEFTWIDDNGTVYFDEDFADGVDDVFSAEVMGYTEKVAAHDLGLKYWNFFEGQNYAPINVGEQEDNFDVEMDICLDVEKSCFGTVWNSMATTPRVSTSLVGVGESTIPYQFKVGTWYHIKWDSENGKTAIYVDDVYVGTVNEAFGKLYEGTQAFWNWDNLSIDNLSIGTFFNDMEGEGLAGYQGVQCDYDLGIVEEKSIFDCIEKDEVGGNAKLVENVWNAQTGNYINWADDIKLPKDGDFIIDFDLAILETTNMFATGDEKDTYFEIWCGWSVGAIQRYQFGTEYVGKNEDLVQYNWGEATKDNFHRVTLQYDNYRAYLYVDGELIYEAPEPDYKKDGALLVMAWNCNVIIDNFQVLREDSYEVVADYSDIPTGSGSEKHGKNLIKEVNLDAENFCATNGCSVGAVEMAYDSTCYSEGQYTVYCSVCGAEKETHSIGLKHHNWSGYDINRTTDSGLVYVYCKTSGCVEKRYTEIPKNYAGTLYQYYDMNDDMALVVGSDSDGTASNGGFETIYDGKACHMITDDGKLVPLGVLIFDEFGEIDRANIPSNDWSISFDIAFDSTKNWVNDGGGVDHEGFYLRCGGNDMMRFLVGYDRIRGELVMYKAGSAGANGLKGMDIDTNFFAKTAYTFEDGKEYNIKISLTGEYAGFTYPEDEWYEGREEWAEIAIWVDGEKVLSYGIMDADTEEEMTALFEFASAILTSSYATLRFPAFTQAGTYYTMDNLAFGSADYAIVKVAGDIDGDGELSAADALMMRQYLAGIITLEDFVDASVADVNGDGAVNAKDQLAIRIALAA